MAFICHRLRRPSLEFHGAPVANTKPDFELGQPQEWADEMGVEISVVVSGGVSGHVPDSDD